MKNLIEILKKFSIKEILEFEEKCDKQFTTLKKLYEKIKNKSLFFKLVLLNAIVSYQLKMRGENYWMVFSGYFSNKKKINLPGDFVEFLKVHNNRFLNVKIRRVYKLWNFLNNLNEKDFEYYCKNLTKLNKDLARIMNQKPDAKTITFAVKMFGYACRIAYNINLPFPKDIFIPMDSRIQKLSKNKKFWMEICNKTNIPMLHLDSLIWVTFNISDQELEQLPNPLRQKVKDLKDLLNSIAQTKSLKS